MNPESPKRPPLAVVVILAPDGGIQVQWPPQIAPAGVKTMLETATETIANIIAQQNGGVMVAHTIPES